MTGQQSTGAVANPEDPEVSVTVRDEDGVRLLGINRSRSRNALDPDSADLLRSLVASAPAAGIGAIVLYGEGGHFCAGGDARSILSVGDDEAAALSAMDRFQGLVTEIWTSRIPVIAAVSGIAYGGGFNLALACDLIHAAADVRFCQVFVERGMVPDLGGAFTLVQAVGPHRARQLIYGAEVVGAEQALNWGFVNAVHPDDAACRTAALTAAREIAARPRAAMALTKRMVNGSTEQGFQGTLDSEAASQSLAMTSSTAQAMFSTFLNR